MLQPEEPCAIAMMFTFSRSSAPNVRPAIPDTPRMSSPTKGDDSNVWIEGDVFALFVHQVWRELAA